MQLLKVIGTQDILTVQWVYSVYRNMSMCVCVYVCLSKAGNG